MKLEITSLPWMAFFNKNPVFIVMTEPFAFAQPTTNALTEVVGKLYSRSIVL